jgi:hypothetical protein
MMDFFKLHKIEVTDAIKKQFKLIF